MLGYFLDLHFAVRCSLFAVRCSLFAVFCFLFSVFVFCFLISVLFFNFAVLRFKQFRDFAGREAPLRQSVQTNSHQHTAPRRKRHEAPLRQSVHTNSLQHTASRSALASVSFNQNNEYKKQRDGENTPSRCFNIVKNLSLTNSATELRHCASQHPHLRCIRRTGCISTDLCCQQRQRRRACTAICTLSILQRTPHRRHTCASHSI